MTGDEPGWPDSPSGRSRWTDAAPRDRIRAIQGQKFRRQAAWVYARSPFWREKFDRAGIAPESIEGVEDASRVPFATKADYRTAQEEDPPYGGLLCRPEEDLKRHGGFVWETSGTTGEPVKFLCSQEEYLRVDVDATRRILRTAGVDQGDVVAMCWPLTLWAVGHGIVDATRTLGATLLPLGPSYSTEHRARKVAEYEPTVVMTTPTYALHLSQVARAEGIDPSSVGVERLVVSGEPLTGATRDAIAGAWGVGEDVYNYYGLSEALNCRSIECEEHDGIHVLEDLYLCEVVEADGGDPLPPGETGELVVTALEQRDIATGFHYRTGDLVRYTDDPCDCGRTTRRIEIVTRKDDMRTIRGVNVFPQAVEAIVQETEGVHEEFRLCHRRDGSLDDLTVLVERDADASRAPADIRAAVRGRMEHAFGGLTVDVEVAAPGELERSTFKADRWVNG